MNDVNCESILAFNRVLSSPNNPFRITGFRIESRGAKVYRLYTANHSVFFMPGSGNAEQMALWLEISNRCKTQPRFEYDGVTFTPLYNNYAVSILQADGLPFIINPTHIYRQEHLIYVFIHPNIPVEDIINDPFGDSTLCGEMFPFPGEWAGPEFENDVSFHCYFDSGSSMIFNNIRAPLDSNNAHCSFTRYSLDIVNDFASELKLWNYTDRHYMIKREIHLNLKAVYGNEYIMVLYGSGGYGTSYGHLGDDGEPTVDDYKGNASPIACMLIKQ